MRKVLILFLALVGIVGLSLAYVYWPSIEHRYKKITVDKGQELKDIQQAKELLNNSKPEEALEIIHKYADNIDNNSEIGKQWLELLIRASEATYNTQQLVLLYEYYPKAFDSHEKAALLVAKVYVATGRGRDYQTLRDNWKGRETNPESWFVLDADKLLLEGKHQEAVELLKSRTFSGKADTSRLIRLALLSGLENPKEAWDYLSQAYAKDPENPEIRSYRAKLLETVGKNSLALSEYIAAIQTDPKNIYLRDQLAEYYLRRKQFAIALQIWEESLKPPSLDFIWLKSIFWNRVIIPIKYDWKSTPVPDGKLKPFIEYLLSIKPGTFWDQSSFEKLPNYQDYLKTQQVTFWLRLLQFLKDGKEKEATDLLAFNPFSTISANPHLESALRKILLYRKSGQFIDPAAESKLSKESDKIRTATLPKDEPFLFMQLDLLSQMNPDEKNKMPPDLQNLLKGPEAFAAAFLATGWNEAALGLHTLDVLPANYPIWYSYELTQALRQNRGNEEGLQFAMKQHQTPALSLLIGETLLSENKIDPAMEYLHKLYKDGNDVGKRAAWLVSLVDIEKGNYTEAKDVVHAQPLLEKSVLGQETLARIALLEGNTQTADQIYTTLEKESPEAKSYLARKAYTEKDWNKARELTEELLREYPTNQLLQQNYKKILEEQNKAKNSK